MFARSNDHINAFRHWPEVSSAPHASHGVHVFEKFLSTREVLVCMEERCSCIIEQCEGESCRIAFEKLLSCSIMIHDLRGSTEIACREAASRLLRITWEIRTMNMIGRHYSLSQSMNRNSRARVAKLKGRKLTRGTRQYSSSRASNECRIFYARKH